MANALQALGARPVLAFSTAEVAEITNKADALYLNLGTPRPTGLPPCCSRDAGPMKSAGPSSLIRWGPAPLIFEKRPAAKF